MIFQASSGVLKCTVGICLVWLTRPLLGLQATSLTEIHPKLHGILSPIISSLSTVNYESNTLSG